MITAIPARVPPTRTSSHLYRDAQQVRALIGILLNVKLCAHISIALFTTKPAPPALDRNIKALHRMFTPYTPLRRIWCRKPYRVHRARLLRRSARCSARRSSLAVGSLLTKWFCLRCVLISLSKAIRGFFIYLHLSASLKRMNRHHLKLALIQPPAPPGPLISCQLQEFAFGAAPGHFHRSLSTIKAPAADRFKC